eukprot:6188004-Pleurochrysis_carterae.AAC.7
MRPVRPVEPAAKNPVVFNFLSTPLSSVEARRLATLSGMYVRVVPSGSIVFWAARACGTVYEELITGSNAIANESV